MYSTAGYTVVFISFFASYSATIVHAALFNYSNIVEAIKNTVIPSRRKERLTDVHYRLISKYSEVPQWWYGLVFLGSTVMAFIALTVYVPEAPKWVCPYSEQALISYSYLRREYPLYSSYRWEC